MSAKYFDVIVVGGGIAGLSAAFAAIRRGKSVAIFEEKEWGGVIRTKRSDGFLMEQGPNVLVLKPELSAMIAELGLSGDVIYPQSDPYKQYVWFNGRPCEVPKSPPALIFSPLLTSRAKAALPVKFFKRGLIGHSEDDLTVRSLFSRIVGEEGVRRLIDGVLKGIYGGDSETLSARSIFPQLWAHLQAGGNLFGYIRAKKSAKPKIFVLRRGMQSLVEALILFLQKKAVFCAQRVTHLTKEGEGFVAKGADGESFKAKEICIATPGAGSLISDFDMNLSSQLASMRFASLAVIHASVPRVTQLRRDSFGVLFPAREPSRLLGIMYNSFLFPHLAPSDCDLMTLCFGGTDAATEVGATDQHLAQFAQQELGERLGISSANILAICRWKNVIPQFEPQHYKIAASARALENSFKGLYLIGADLGGVGVPDRVRIASNWSQS